MEGASRVEWRVGARLYFPSLCHFSAAAVARSGRWVVVVELFHVVRAGSNSVESEGDPPAKGAFRLRDQGHGRGSHGCCVVFGMEGAVDFAEVVNEDFGGVVVR